MTKTLALISRIVLLIVATNHLAPRTADAAEIRVLYPGAFAESFKQLIPRFERTSGQKIDAVRVGPSYILNRIRSGERGDVVIVPDDMLNQVIQDGRIIAGSRTPLARSSIGMVIRAGASKPDINSVEALKRTLLKAKSIAYSSQISGIYLSTELFPRLGIADQVKRKSKQVDGEPVGAVIARGEAEIGFQQISELLPIPGVDYVGPLPSEVQRITLFSAAAVADSKSADAAQRFISFLLSRDATAVFAKNGLEPPRSEGREK